ncbi:MAG: hypothetical protein ACLUNO_09505 [Oscillospiraceae bacterium]
MATKYKYDKDTDYAALMERAAQRGDNAAAAIYEQQRNAKIRGEGMADQEQTNDYLQYLPVEDVPDYDGTHRREAETLLSERGTTAQRDRIDRMLDTLLGEEFDYDPASDKLLRRLPAAVRTAGRSRGGQRPRHGGRADRRAGLDGGRCGLSAGGRVLPRDARGQAAGAGTARLRALQRRAQDAPECHRQPARRGRQPR